MASHSQSSKRVFSCYHLCKYFLHNYAAWQEVYHIYYRVPTGVVRVESVDSSSTRHNWTCEFHPPVSQQLSPRLDLLPRIYTCCNHRSIDKRDHRQQLVRIKLPCILSKLVNLVNWDYLKFSLTKGRHPKKNRKFHDIVQKGG